MKSLSEGNGNYTRVMTRFLPYQKRPSTPKSQVTDTGTPHNLNLLWITSHLCNQNLSRKRWRDFLSQEKPKPPKSFTVKNIEWKRSSAPLWTLARSGTAHPGLCFMASEGQCRNGSKAHKAARKAPSQLYCDQPNSSCYTFSIRLLLASEQQKVTYSF